MASLSHTVLLLFVLFLDFCSSSTQKLCLLRSLDLNFFELQQETPPTYPLCGASRAAREEVRSPLVTGDE